MFRLKLDCASKREEMEMETTDFWCNTGLPWQQITMLHKKWGHIFPLRWCVVSPWATFFGHWFDLITCHEPHKKVKKTSKLKVMQGTIVLTAKEWRYSKPWATPTAISNRLYQLKYLLEPFGPINGKKKTVEKKGAKSMQYQIPRSWARAHICGLTSLNLDFL